MKCYSEDCRDRLISYGKWNLEILFFSRAQWNYCTSSSSPQQNQRIAFCTLLLVFIAVCCRCRFHHEPSSSVASVHVFVSLRQGRFAEILRHEPYHTSGVVRVMFCHWSKGSRAHLLCTSDNLCLNQKRPVQVIIIYSYCWALLSSRLRYDCRSSTLCTKMYAIGDKLVNQKTVFL